MLQGYLEVAKDRNSPRPEAHLSDRRMACTCSSRLFGLICGMRYQTLADKVANSLLLQAGIAIIWKLHEDAATLHRVGNLVGAASLLEVADAAEREWQRRCAGAAESAQTSRSASQPT
jgi:hypothetical protein